MNQELIQTTFDSCNVIKRWTEILCDNIPAVEDIGFIQFGGRVTEPNAFRNLPSPFGGSIGGFATNARVNPTQAVAYQGTISTASWAIYDVTTETITSSGTIPAFYETDGVTLVPSNNGAQVVQSMEYNHIDGNYYILTVGGLRGSAGTPVRFRENLFLWRVNLADGSLTMVSEIPLIGNPLDHNYRGFVITDSGDTYITGYEVATNETIHWQVDNLFGGTTLTEIARYTSTTGATPPGAQASSAPDGQNFWVGNGDDPLTGIELRSPNGALINTVYTGLPANSSSFDSATWREQEADTIRFIRCYESINGVITFEDLNVDGTPYTVQGEVTICDECCDDTDNSCDNPVFTRQTTDIVEAYSFSIGGESENLPGNSPDNGWEVSNDSGATYSPFTGAVTQVVGPAGTHRFRQTFDYECDGEITITIDGDKWDGSLTNQPAGEGELFFNGVSIGSTQANGDPDVFTVEVTAGTNTFEWYHGEVTGSGLVNPSFEFSGYQCLDLGCETVYKITNCDGIVRWENGDGTVYVPTGNEVRGACIDKPTFSWTQCLQYEIPSESSFIYTPGSATQSNIFGVELQSCSTAALPTDPPPTGLSRNLTFSQDGTVFYRASTNPPSLFATYDAVTGTKLSEVAITGLLNPRTGNLATDWVTGNVYASDFENPANIYEVDVNTATYTLIGTVPFQGQSGFTNGLAVYNGRFFWLDSISNTITEVDITTNTVISTLLTTTDDIRSLDATVEGNLIYANVTPSPAVNESIDFAGNPVTMPFGCTTVAFPGQGLAVAPTRGAGTNVQFNRIFHKDLTTNEITFQDHDLVTGDPITLPDGVEISICPEDGGDGNGSGGDVTVNVEPSESDELQVLCDVNGNVSTPFIRRVTNDGEGGITVTDTEIDMVTPYTVTGFPEVCPDVEYQIQTYELCAVNDSPPNYYNPTEPAGEAYEAGDRIVVSILFDVANITTPYAFSYVNLSNGTAPVPFSLFGPSGFSIGAFPISTDFGDCCTPNSEVFELCDTVELGPYPVVTGSNNPNSTLQSYTIDGIPGPVLGSLNNATILNTLAFDEDNNVLVAWVTFDDWEVYDADTLNLVASGTNPPCLNFGLNQAAWNPADGLVYLKRQNNPSTIIPIAFDYQTNTCTNLPGLSGFTPTGANEASFAFDDSGTFYLRVGLNIYTVDPLTGVATLFHTITGLGGTPVGLEFVRSSNSLLIGSAGSGATDTVLLDIGTQTETIFPPGGYVSQITYIRQDETSSTLESTEFIRTITENCDGSTTVADTDYEGADYTVEGTVGKCCCNPEIQVNVEGDSGSCTPRREAIKLCDVDNSDPDIPVNTTFIRIITFECDGSTTFTDLDLDGNPYTPSAPENVDRCCCEVEEEPPVSVGSVVPGILVTSAAGNTSLNAQKVVITNSGGAPGIVSGGLIPPGHTVTYEGYFDNGSNTYFRLNQIAYDASGTEFIIEVTP